MKPDLTIIAGAPGGAGPADGPDAAEAGTPNPEGTPSDDQCVPLAALAMPDDKEAMQTPAEGDMVSYQVEGKVSKVVGENAYVTPSAINGQPVEADEKEPTPEDQDAAGLQDLQNQAGAMDQQQAGS